MGTAEMQNPPGRSRTETASSFSQRGFVQAQLLALSKGSRLLSSFCGRAAETRLSWESLRGASPPAAAPLLLLFCSGLREADGISGCPFCLRA